MKSLSREGLNSAAAACGDRNSPKHPRSNPGHGTGTIAAARRERQAGPALPHEGKWGELRMRVEGLAEKAGLVSQGPRCLKWGKEGDLWIPMGSCGEGSGVLGGRRAARRRRRCRCESPQGPSLPSPQGGSVGFSDRFPSKYLRPHLQSVTCCCEGLPPSPPSLVALLCAVKDSLLRFF